VPRNLTCFSLCTQISDDLNCQKITAYYDGIFEHPLHRSDHFTATLKITIDINLDDKLVYFKVDKFEKSHANGYKFEILDQISGKA
jgi:hypothetical protein